MSLKFINLLNGVLIPHESNVRDILITQIAPLSHYSTLNDHF
jgi:hypothetical protein